MRFCKTKFPWKTGCLIELNGEAPVPPLVGNKDYIGLCFGNTGSNRANTGFGDKLNRDAGITI